MAKSASSNSVFKAQHLARAKLLKEGRYIRLLSIDQWEFVTRKNCSGIVIIVSMTTDYHVVLVEQYRIPVGKNVLEFPAGLVNDQKSSRQERLVTAAKREFFEETGYRAKKFSILIEGPGSGGSSADLITFVLAEGLTKTGQGGGIEDEQIVVHEVPLDRIDQWLNKKQKAGVLVDPKIYSGLYFLRQIADRAKR